MSKKWYPVVDVLSCIECGTCVNNCPHSVYDKSKTPSPIVINPDSCVEHCHHCGDNCPVGAITYVGNNIGWIRILKNTTPDWLCARSHQSIYKITTPTN